MNGLAPVRALCLVSRLLYDSLRASLRSVAHSIEPADSYGTVARHDELPYPKTTLDIFSIASYDHNNKMIQWKTSLAPPNGQSQGFDQYADQYPDISGWTQGTMVSFLSRKNGAKSTGKRLIADLRYTDRSSHA